jgi:hypothetical protein
LAGGAAAGGITRETCTHGRKFQWDSGARFLPIFGSVQQIVAGLSPWSVWSGLLSLLGSTVSRADFARIFFDFTGFSKDSALREVFRR